MDEAPWVTAALHGSSEDQKWQQSHCYAAAVTEGPPAQGPPLKEPAGSAILALGRWAMMGGDMGARGRGCGEIREKTPKEGKQGARELWARGMSGAPASPC